MMPLRRISVARYHQSVVTSDIDLSFRTGIKIPADVNQFTADIPPAHGSGCRVLPDCYRLIVLEVLADVLDAKFDGPPFMRASGLIRVAYQQSDPHIGLFQSLQEHSSR